MSAEQISSADRYAQVLNELSGLRWFSGPPAEFWTTFLRSTAALTSASHAALVVKPAATENWKRLAQWSAEGKADRYSVAFARALAEVAERCGRNGGLVQALDSSLGANGRPFVLAVHLQLPKSEEVCVAVFLLLEAIEAQAREALLRLRLVADIPSSYHLQQIAQQARTDVEKFATTLDLMVQINAEKRFVAAALAFCNGLASRHRCGRVALGWLEHGYIRLQAISRTEHFDRNMAAVKALEIAMEECLDQGEEVVWPAAAGTSLVTRDHDAYARAQAVQFLGSVPLRLEGETIGVLTCERQSEAFTETEVQQLRLSCDQAVRRLADLKRTDRWFGARLWAATREQLGRLLGVEHTWPKFIGVTCGLLLVLLLVIRINYRVEANFLLRSDEAAFITAPFDGFIDEVRVRLSDPVQPQQPLLTLAKDELELEESAAIADLTRYSREAEKARAINALADMRIAQALADQARARLELARYRLDQSTLKSPLAGVVVEGDQKERLGAPVKQGEVLFKVARTDTLYVEAEVNERDVHEVLDQASGEVAFASQPRLKFPMQVVRIQAASQPKDKENVFLVRCALTGKPESWWRPGMSGVSKINVGRRSLIWVVTHRTIDYLRLLLWW